MTETNWATLLESAVTEPGELCAAYTAFHNYSLGNILLAMGQCHARELPLGPMATFPKWIELGRYVRKGEKAITLCQPVTIKRKADEANADSPEDETFTRFTYRNRWFVLAQTDGEPLAPVVPPEWNRARALSALDISEREFDCINGNIMGYAIGRQIAISPLNPHPFSTLFHEIGHILLGHTEEAALPQDDRTPRTLREAEAESVALLVCASLNLPGASDSRAYIQHWYGQGNPIPDTSARRIFKAADTILKAGRETPETEVAA